MGILDFVFKVNQFFNQANDHWKAAQAAVLDGNEDEASRELLEAIRLCQLAVSSNRKDGDSYVMLAHALLSLSAMKSLEETSKKSLRNSAAAAIQKWMTLPSNRYPITKNYEQGVYVYQLVSDEIKIAEECSLEHAQTLVTELGERLGDLVVDSPSYELIESTVARGKLTHRVDLNTGQG